MAKESKEEEQPKVPANSPKTRSQKKRARCDQEHSKSMLGMNICKKRKDDEDNEYNEDNEDEIIGDEDSYSEEDDDDSESIDDFIVDDDEEDEDEDEDEEYDEEYHEEYDDDTTETTDESYQESENDEESEKPLVIYNRKNKNKKKRNKLSSEEEDKTEKYSKDEYDYFCLQLQERRSLILEKQDEAEKFQKKDVPFRFEILLSKMSLGMKNSILEKIDQLSQMQGYESDYFKLMKWVNGISRMPFSNYIKLPFDDKLSVNQLLENHDAVNFLKNANQIMRKSTYGHEMAKDRIIQVITKWISNPSSKGNVIAFQGPPGIGKTSLARNGIAKAINRPFSFLALGGATDASFLEGFSFTYEGSQWGRICQILMDAKCMNPVIFMDELDKISKTDKGNEIAGLLTHITDSSQNEEYEDRYFSGVKIDLSKALFIFSYNDSSLINPILRDRITEIRLDGYKKNDKIIIAKDYSIPELMDNVGFNKDDISFSDEVLGYIIDNYTEEEGVRSLRRCIETILMKLNVYRFLKNNSDELTYKIDDFAIPYSLTNNTVDILLKDMKDKTGKLSESAQSLYV